MDYTSRQVDEHVKNSVIGLMLLIDVCPQHMVDALTGRDREIWRRLDSNSYVESKDGNLEDSNKLLE